jgi:CheY-like chemotaxis protein
MAQVNESATQRRRVLVVDDREDSVFVTRALLEHLGHTVEVANNGPDALLRAEAFNPEYVLCDLLMPGMNGWEVARQMRVAPGGQGRVLIALSGRSGSDEEQRSREAGFNYHLVKPVDIAHLAKIVGS